MFRVTCAVLSRLSPSNSSRQCYCMRKCFLHATNSLRLTAIDSENVNDKKKAVRSDDLKVDMADLEEALKRDEKKESINHKETILKLREQKKAIREIFTGKLAMIIVGVSVILVIILSGLREKKMRELESERKQTIGKARIGGPWELVDVNGELGGSERLKGNWLLLYFGFTHCPDVCPDSIEKMVEVVEILEKSEEKIRVIPVFISVDPERDTVERVKKYCAEFSPKIKGYTGSKEQVAKVAKAFRVYYSQGPKIDGNDYIVDHTVIMYLMDPDGDFHDYYGQNRSAQEIAKVIKLKMATPATPKQYTVRIPKRNGSRRYSVLKFNGTLKIDPGKWAMADYSIRMAREDNKEQAAVNEIRQDYGEGSEYGKALREEARRKKYGRQFQTYQHDNQPWVLSITDPSTKERRFRSIREGGAGEHADYWVFLKSGEEFHAYKVDEWYQFMPFSTHRTLDIDQAEERFRERNRVMNQFALKAQIQQQLKAMDEDGEQMIKTTKSLKIKDEASSDENSDGEKGDDEDDAPVGSSKPKKNSKPTARARKDKRQRVENADEVAAYESDDGDDEGREYDYMSDSGSESDRDVVPMEQKVDEAMVAVGDETGLKKLIGDDFSDTDSSDMDDTTKKLLFAVEDDDGDEIKKQFIDVDERGKLSLKVYSFIFYSSGSDSDDPDKEINSAIFLPVKKTLEEPQSSTRKRPLENVSFADNEVKRIKTEQAFTAPSLSPTQSTTNQDSLNEETVRRYLRRKPHTTKELLSKIKSKCGDMEKSEIVQKLAAILKRIEPHQFKQKHGKKEVLFFSLNNNLA
ncbi:Transcription initiation factor IIF alpha subunit (TFIIF-alpha) family protein [Brugia pahangi]